MSQTKLKSIKGVKPTCYFVTANALLSGDVVYLGADNSWSLALTDAKSFYQIEEASAAADDSNHTQAHQVVGAYVLGASRDGQPLSTKEQLRATGPSNYFHGKQQVV